MPDLARLDSGDDLVSHTEHGVVAEAGQDLLARIFREGGALLGLLDDLTEVPAAHMLDAGPLHQTPGVEAVGVAVGRALDAVGVEDDGAGEVGEFLGLVLPGAAEVAHQVGVLLQAGVAVGREHLTVGVDVDAGAFGLLEQLLQHLQVVAGDQDTLAGLGAQVDGGRDRMPIGIGVGGVEQSHHGQVLLAALHGEADEVHQSQTRVGAGGQRLLEEGHDLIVAAAQDHGVVHIGGHPFQAVHENLDHGADVFVDVQGVEAVLLTLGDHAGQVVGRFPVSHRTGDGGARSGLCLFLQLVAALDHAADDCGVEVHIGDSREEPLDGKTVDLGVSSQFIGIERQGFQAVEQVVLQGRHIRFFSADAGNVAAGAVCCLLALITEHTHDDSSRGCDCSNRFDGTVM